jgi:serine/threonine protein kinase
VTKQGVVIADRYRLLDRVGHGAMGVVWRARDDLLDRVVAVKQLLDDVNQDADLREGRVAARLRHPHAITVHDAVEQAGQRYLIMEYFPSESLSALVAESGPLPAETVARIGSEVAAALAAAHGEGIVHRDIKPANVLVNAAGLAKIADFGISQALGDGTLTGDTTMIGTPAYLAPEVAGGEGAGFSSDVFSFGATLYTALEGAPPFGFDDNPIAMLRRVAQGVITPPRHRGPLVDVLLWMLRPHPGERPTMAEAHDALTAVAEGHPTNAPIFDPDPLPALPPPRPRPHVSRRRAGAALLALVLIGAGVVIGILIPRHLQSTTAAAPAGAPPATTTSQAIPPRATPPQSVPTTTATTAITYTTTTTATATYNAPNPVAAPYASPQQLLRSDCAATLRVTNAWPDGYQAEITIANQSASTLSGWTLHWTLPANQSLTNLWNGKLTQNGSAITVDNFDYNAHIPTNGTATVGYTASSTSGDTPAISCQTR